MISRTSFFSTIVLSVLVAAPAANSASGQTPVARITQSIDNNLRVTVGGNVHPLVIAATSSALADESTPMEHMILYLKADSGQESQLEQLIAGQNDPKSAAYHQYLASQDFASKFGVAQSDVTTVTSWLQQHGFVVEQVPAGSRSIVFSGTAGQIAAAFNTQIRRYNVAGASHIANASDPQLPAALSSVVGGIVKLNDFRHGHNLTSPKALSTAEVAHPQFTSGSSNHYLAPADYGVIYDINPLYSAGVNGTGQAVAVIARSNIYMSDVQGFRSSFGLKANNPQFVITNSDPGILQGDSVETTLDTEWSGAVAPNAAIKVVISNSSSSTDGIDLSSLYAVSNNVAPVITLSYGSCEAAMGSSELAFYNSLWKQAAAQGQTVLVSAGDNGAAGCDYGSSAVYGHAINGLCSSPYATCVGGTEFVEGNNPGQYWLPGNNPTYGSAISYIPEAVWNESGTVSGGSGLWAGSGGSSIIYPKPAWQTGPGVPSDSRRDVPDISLTAAGGHDGYLIWLNGGLNSVGGTSAAAPSFAGMMALLNQRMNSRQGVINPILYPLAAKQASGGPAVFHDTKLGNNSVPGQAGFSATTGYDLASGLGSVDTTLMVNNWITATSTNPTITLTASVPTLNVAASKTGSITITSATNAVNAAVAMSVTGAPAGIVTAFASASIASPGAGNDVLTITASSSVTPGAYTLSIKGVSGNVMGSVAISLVVPAPTFTLSPTSAALTAAANTGVQTALTVTPQYGFNSTVSMSAVNLPSGVTAAFLPASVSANSNGATVATFAVAKTTNAGTYVFNIVASGGGVTQTSAISLTVTAPPSFLLTTNVSSLTAYAGSTAQVFVSTTAQSNFSAAIAFSVSGLPAGVTGLFTGSSANSNLTLTLASNAAPGSSSITITASGGGVTKTASVVLTVAAKPICNLAANPSALSLTAGQSANMALTCTVSQGSFPTALALSIIGAPSGMTVQASANLTAGSASNVAITTGLNLAGGRYPLTVMVTGSSYTQTISVPVTITAASTFTFTSSMNALTLKPGTSGQVSFTTQHFGSFNAAIALNLTGLPSGVTASLSRSAMAAPGDGTSQFTFTATSAARSGTFSALVTATGGGITESLPVSIIVNAGPSFTLSLSANAITVVQGGSGSITSSTGNYINGFNGQLTMSYTRLPRGVNYSITGANAANNMVNITASFSVPSSLPVGTYPITLVDVGNSGSATTGNGVTQTAAFNLVVTVPSSQTKH